MAIEKVHLNKLPTGLKNIYSKAEDLVKKNKNYDYGITLLNDLVKAVPGFQEARELLRLAEKERAKTVVGFAKFSGMIKASLAVFKGKALLKKNPMDALSLAEDALAFCYYDGSLRFYCQVALELDEIELAIDAMERVYELNPESESVMYELIDLLDGVPGHAVRILQLRQKIATKHPRDLKVQTALRAAAAAATMEQNAMKAEEKEKEKEKVATRDNGTGAPDLSDLERGDRIIRSEEDIKEMIRRYEQVVESGQATLDILRKLAEYYQKVNMHEKAIETYQKLSEKQGVADITVDKAIEKSNVALANEQIQQMIDSGAAEEEIAEARRSLLQYQIECGNKRIADHPNDLQYRYEQGMLYFESGMFAEAAPEFEAASKIPQRKELSLTYAARCYASLGDFDKSVGLLKPMLEGMTYMDNQKMRVLYYLGTTYELMQDTAAAYDCFKQVFDSNAKYMDVAEKVKKLAPPAPADAEAENPAS